MSVAPTRDNIWQFTQNKPTLVARDLEQFVPADVIYAALLRRGVFKWLAVRRDLIRLKDSWKREIIVTLAEIRRAKATGDRDALHRARGRLEAIVSCRESVRSLCHSDRWQCPDHDSKAREWLYKSSVNTKETQNGREEHPRAW